MSRCDPPHYTSGAGKSTLVSLIPRFHHPTAGCIRINDRDIREIPLRALREEIAIVPQDVVLFNASVKENIRYGRLDASDLDIRTAARKANAHRFIEELPHGYDTEVGNLGSKLSTGQRQRIAIARAFLKNAHILILDEPTSAIDSASEAEIQDALRRLAGCLTTFIIAHRLMTVRTADRIIVLASGEIVEEGTHDDLVSRGGLYAMLAAHYFEGRLKEIHLTRQQSQ